MIDAEQQVQAYIDGVVNGDIVVGRHVRQCVERHLWDLEHAHDRGLYFDTKKAAAAVNWFSICLVHVKGEWAGQPVELTDNQAFILWCVFGWRRGDGTRRFRHVYISCARKWGKSTMAAGIGLLCLTFDDPLEAGAEIYCFATKEDQARIVHKTAQQMARDSDILRTQCDVMSNVITTKANSFQPYSFFKPLGSDSKTMDGLNVHVAIADEIHEFQRHHQGLWDKLTTASGSRRNWMVITITTAGDDNSELWQDVEKLCMTALGGYKQDEPPGDNRFVFIARLDEKHPCECGGLDHCRKCGGAGEIPEDDIFDEANWPKANPNYPVTPKPEFLREQADDAKNSPKSLHAFKRYHCNMRVSSLSKAIHDEVWARARKDHCDWSDADVICGAWDAGGQDDLGAIGLCARFETGEFEVDKTTGEPTDRPLYRYEVDAIGFINQGCERDLTLDPWCRWIDEGLLRVCRLESVEMRQEVIQAYQRDGVSAWAYDPANSKDFAQSLEPEGIECFKFYQNAGMWTEPITNFLAELKKQRITHNGNGLLTWAAGNMITFQASRKSQIQIMPDKASSPEKIDPIVAVIMAYRMAAVAPARTRGALFIA